MKTIFNRRQGLLSFGALLVVFAGSTAAFARPAAVDCVETLQPETQPVLFKDKIRWMPEMLRNGDVMLPLLEHSRTVKSVVQDLIEVLSREDTLEYDDADLYFALLQALEHTHSSKVQGDSKYAERAASVISEKMLAYYSKYEAFVRLRYPGQLPVAADGSLTHPRALGQAAEDLIEKEGLASFRGDLFNRRPQ